MTQGYRVCCAASFLDKRSKITTSVFQYFHLIVYVETLTSWLSCGSAFPGLTSDNLDGDGWWDCSAAAAAALLDLAIWNQTNLLQKYRNTRFCESSRRTFVTWRGLFSKSSTVVKITNSKQECIPVGCVLPAAVVVGGVSGPDPPEFAPWVWAWIWSPWICPLDVGLDLIPLNLPLGCGPGFDPPEFPPWVRTWIWSPSIEKRINVFYLCSICQLNNFAIKNSN